MSVKLKSAKRAAIVPITRLASGIGLRRSSNNKAPTELDQRHPANNKLVSELDIICSNNNKLLPETDATDHILSPELDLHGAHINNKPLSQIDLRCSADENDANENIYIISENAKNDNNNIHEIKLIHTNPVENEKTFEPPDGGWGWWVLFGAFLSFIFVSLPPVTYGILFEPLWKRFHTSSAMIAWIYNIHICVCNITNLTVNPLCEEFGWRVIAFIGGLINGISYVLSAFTPCEAFLFFSFSTLGGIGRSLGNCASIYIVSKYFLKRRGFALGIMTLGTCAGGFLGPLLSNLLVEHYGFKGACLVFGGFVFNQCVAAVLFEPIERHLIVSDPKTAYKNEPEKEDADDETNDNENNETDTKNLQIKLMRKKLTRRISEISQYSSGLTEQSAISFPAIEQINKMEIKSPSNSSQPVFIGILIRIFKSTFSSLKSLRSLQVFFIAISAGCLRMGYMNFQMWIPFVVRDAGHTLELSAWVLSAAAIANAVSRLLISAIADCEWFSVKGAYLAGMAGMAVSIGAFTLKTDFTAILICVIIWGFALGMSMSLYSTSIINVVGVEMFPTVYGIASLFIALFFLVAGPILGMVQDLTANYSYTMWVLSCITIIGVPLWLLMPLATKFDKAREKRRVHFSE